MTTNLGVDYSTKKIYIACLCEESFVSQIPFTKAGDVVLELMALFTDQFENFGCRSVGIERPWSAYNPQTGMQMTRVATVIELSALLAGLEVHLIHPGSWRKEIFGSNTFINESGESEKIKKPKFKEMAIKFANENGLITTNDNEADAFCIAHYMKRKHDVGDAGNDELRLCEGEGSSRSGSSEIAQGGGSLS